jgi:hypothetical protein
LFWTKNPYTFFFEIVLNSFRDGCLHLFGYRVEMRDAPGGATTFVLRSMFSAESEQLVFTLSSDAALTIEPTTYTTENPEVKKQVRARAQCHKGRWCVRAVLYSPIHGSRAEADTPYSPGGYSSQCTDIPQRTGAHHPI